MCEKKPRLIALDMDGTLTQHRTEIEPENLAALWALKARYRLVLIGAGACQRIHRQLRAFPMDIIGNYGMEWAAWDDGEKRLNIIKRNSVSYTPSEVAAIKEKAQMLRQRLGYTSFRGDSMEFHASGMLTFPLLGTKAPIEEKLCFDPDKKKRTIGYEDVVKAFDNYTVFIGGSSSYDIVPRPYHKLYALTSLAQASGLAAQDVVFIGDDWGPGGNDEPVYNSAFPFIKIQNHRQFPQLAAKLVGR